jgi:hypothetical protein
MVLMLNFLWRAGQRFRGELEGGPQNPFLLRPGCPRGSNRANWQMLDLTGTGNASSVRLRQ